MARSYQDLLASAREQVPEVQVADLAARRARRRRPAGRSTSASSTSGTRATSPAPCTSPAATSRAASPASPSPDQEVILSCASGNRSLLAGRTLQEMGYEQRVEPRRRLHALEAERPATATCRRRSRPDQRSRYSRHILIPEVGEEGQLKLLDAKALLIGAGGLGSPAALYLAAAGVGTLGLVDDDVVDASNLQRQIIHTTDRVGCPRASRRAIAIEALNPDVTVNVHPFRVNKDNVLDLIADYDVIIDGTDNFPTRYLMNDACADARQAAHPREHPPLRGPRLGVPARTTGPATAASSRSPRRRTWRRRCGEAGVLGVLCGRDGQHPGHRGDQGDARHRRHARPAAC